MLIQKAKLCVWGPDNQWGDIDHASGLSAPVGIISNTGVAGLTLGSGLGYLTPKYKI